MRAKKSILCVDDNEQLLSIRKIMLETRGYRVFEFSSALEALECFKHRQIDLVLTDWEMPDFDGPWLAGKIKTMSPDTPVILISGKHHVSPEATQADLFLGKGMHPPAELLDCIRMRLVRKRGPKKARDFVAPVSGTLPAGQPTLGGI